MHYRAPHSRGGSARSAWTRIRCSGADVTEKRSVFAEFYASFVTEIYADCNDQRISAAEGRIEARGDPA